MDNTIVRRGYVTLHKGGKFPFTTLISRRMWIILFQSAGSPLAHSRIEMYRTEDQTGNSPIRVIELETIRALRPIDRKRGFMLDLLDESMLFQCTSKADLEDWTRDINRLRGAVDQSSGQLLPDFPSGQDLYDVVPDDEIFHVKLRKSTTMRFSGHCLLEILRDFDRNLFHIALFTEDELPRLIVKWQIDHIRQYGSNQVAFKFQSGSKSSTGVDWFIVDTDYGAAVRIHKAVDYWAKHIVDQIKNMQCFPGRMRAPSAPATPSSNPPDRPSRMAQSPPATMTNQTYQPINPGTQIPSGVYTEIPAAKHNKKKDSKKAAESPIATAPPSATTSERNSAGVYQPLLVKKEDANTYEVLNRRGKARPASNAPPPDNRQ